MPPCSQSAAIAGAANANRTIVTKASQDRNTEASHNTPSTYLLTRQAGIAQASKGLAMPVQNALFKRREAWQAAGRLQQLRGGDPMSSGILRTAMSWSLGSGSDQPLVLT